MTSKGVTSNSKIAKKVRQQFNRKIKAEVTEQVEVLKKAVRDKPKYAPKWLWSWMVGLVYNEQIIKEWFKSKQ